MTIKRAYPDAELTLESLFDAYFDCRRHKRNTLHQLAFEADLERNLMALWRDLCDGSYTIGRSIAFVVTYPKAREVWAASSPRLSSAPMARSFKRLAIIKPRA